MSIGALTSQVVPSMLETVRPKMSYFLAQKQSKMMNMFNKAAEKHNVSAFYAGTVGSAGGEAGSGVLAWRVPVTLFMGGDYQAISLDGGDLGTGSMMGTAYMTFGTFENDIAFNIPARAIYGTKDAKQAVVNALQFSLGKAISEMALYNEIGFFNDSTGTLMQGNGTGSPVIASTQVTYNLESTFGLNRMRGQNMLVDVYSTANVLQFAGARVAGYSYANNTITLSGVNTYTPVNTDQIMFPNMGTPVSTYTAAAGSWRNGLYVFSTTTTSGSLGGLSYANAPELATPTVNGASGFYTPALTYSGRAQLIQRRDEEAYSEVIGICHTAQWVSASLQGIVISNWLREAKTENKSIDIGGAGAPSYDQSFEWCGTTHYISRYAGKTRVDWVRAANFGWAQLSEIDFFQSAEGQRIFVGRSSTTGNPQAGNQFYVVNTRQLYSVDPGCGVCFVSLQVPAGQ